MKSIAINRSLLGTSRVIREQFPKGFALGGQPLHPIWPVKSIKSLFFVRKYYDLER
jgi:hypothetical protein